MVEIIPAALAGERVDRVVALLTGLPRTEVSALVSRGGVRLAGRTVTTRAARVAAGDELDVEVPEPSPLRAPVEAEPDVVVPVVHADDWVVVVDKPSGLVVHPGAGNPRGTMVAGLLSRYPDLAGVGAPERPGVVHRLDKATSGLLVVARTPAAYDALVAQLRDRRVERRYLALVAGVPEPETGMVDAPLARSRRDPTRMAVSAGGREARTAYEVLERFADPDTALLACSLETGRTHQIRAHLAAIGHPVAGDTRYGHRRRDRTVFPRVFLHATRLAFDHPGTGERVAFDAPLPPDLEAVLETLR